MAMDSIQQILTSNPQLASSATSVAGALAKPRTSSTGSTSSTSSTASSTSANSTTITADDFLTLLVAEMKNQDPTQPTDPNQYITQMVDVNSLQQLIGINQGVTSLDSAAGASTGSTASSSVSGTGTSQ
jgi:flagellar basal-body rod modification protein FlgD